MLDLHQEWGEEARTLWRANGLIAGAGGAAAVVRAARERANPPAEDQRLSGDRGETRSGRLKEKISMTSQRKCVIYFSTGFGTLPDRLLRDGHRVSPHSNPSRGLLPDPLKIPGVVFLRVPILQLLKEFHVQFAGSCDHTGDFIVACGDKIVAR